MVRLLLLIYFFLILETIIFSMAISFKENNSILITLNLYDSTNKNKSPFYLKLKHMNNLIIPDVYIILKSKCLYTLYSNNGICLNRRAVAGCSRTITITILNLLLLQAQFYSINRRVPQEYSLEKLQAVINIYILLLIF